MTRRGRPKSIQQERISKKYKKVTKNIERMPAKTVLSQPQCRPRMKKTTLRKDINVTEKQVASEVNIASPRTSGRTKRKYIPEDILNNSTENNTSRKDVNDQLKGSVSKMSITTEKINTPKKNKPNTKVETLPNRTTRPVRIKYTNPKSKTNSTITKQDSDLEIFNLPNFDSSVGEETNNNIVNTVPVIVKDINGKNSVPEVKDTSIQSKLNFSSIRDLRSKLKEIMDYDVPKHISHIEGETVFNDEERNEFDIGNDQKLHENIKEVEFPRKQKNIDVMSKRPHLSTKFVSNEKEVKIGVKLLKCNNCDFSCDKLSILKIHKTIHSGEIPTKELCVVKHNDKLYIDKPSVINITYNTFKCSECDFSCKRYDILKIHKTIHSKNSKELFYERDHDEEGSDWSDQEIDFKCEDDENTRESYVYSNHIDFDKINELNSSFTFEPQNCNTDIEVPKPNQEAIHKSKENTKKSTSVKDKIKPTKMKLNAAREKLNTITLDCYKNSDIDSCSSLNENNRNSREGDVSKLSKNLDKCSKSFPVTINSITHPRYRQLICEDCDSSFAYKYHLDSHKLIHLKQNHMMENKLCRGIVCLDCGMSYKTKELMEKHTVSKRRPLKCDQCKFFTSNLCQLSLHKNSHLQPPYKCEKCESLLNSLEEFENHIESHVKSVLDSGVEKRITNVMPFDFDKSSNPSSPDHLFFYHPCFVNLQRLSKKEVTMGNTKI